MKTEWYRRPKARVSPRDAAYFDDLRKSGNHPAATYDALPYEVQSVISQLEIENMDLRRERSFSAALFFAGVGVLDLALVYFGSIGRLHFADPRAWDYFASFVLIGFGVFQFVRANQCDLSDIDGRFHEEWEINYVVGPNASASADRSAGEDDEEPRDTAG